MRCSLIYYTWLFEGADNVNPLSFLRYNTRMSRATFGRYPALVLACGLWYITTTVATIEAKDFFLNNGRAIQFTLLSFVLAVPLWLICEVREYFLNMEEDEESSPSSPDHPHLKLQDRYRGLRSLPSAIFNEIASFAYQNILTIILHVLHTHFTNLMVEGASVKFAFMFLTVEPLATLVLYQLVYKTQPKIMLMCSLLPVPIGVILSNLDLVSGDHNEAVHHHALSPKVFFCSVLSVLTVSARNVLFKNKGTASKSNQDNSTLWYLRLCTTGTFLVIPPYLFYLIFQSGSHPVPGPKSALVAGALMHIVYNIMAFVVLNMIEPVSHSLLNVFKKILVVMFSMAYYRSSLIPLQLFGILLSNFGLVAYVLLKRYQPADERESKTPPPRLGPRFKMISTAIGTGLLVLSLIGD